MANTFAWEPKYFASSASYAKINGALNILFLTGLGGFIAQSLEEQLFRWLRAAELTCDRAALLVAQDPKVYELKNCMF